MIDWHSHILPGIDDGSLDSESSLEMAALLASYGFTTVYCTPHLMRGCYEADNDQVRQGVADLQELLNSRAIQLTLFAGREYCLDEYLLTSLEDPLPLGDSRLILIEILPQTAADVVCEILYNVVRAGFTPVIAHPERCRLLEPFVHRAGSKSLLDNVKSILSGGRYGRKDATPPDTTDNPLLVYLRDLGCLFQGNLGSFNGFYGARAQAVAEELRRLNVYDRYGTDLHSPQQAQMILGSNSAA
jgi:protein-tyrosine phosphatase